MVNMTQRAQDLLKNALTLTESERADLAAELIASLDEASDDPRAVEAAWVAEIERRARRVLSGESQGEAWEDVRRRIEADLRKQ